MYMQAPVGNLKLRTNIIKAPGAYAGEYSGA